ncbi:MAG: MarR family transcriptional regulator [Granulicella sp.]
MGTAENNEIGKRRRATAQLMRRIMVEFRGQLDEELRPYGVTTAQIKVLWAVRDWPGSSGAQLSRLCQVTPQSAQALIQRAEVEGWIVRSKDRTNERIIRASLTPSGKQLLKTADRVAKTIEARLWHGVPIETIDVLNGTLEQCLRNISAE